MTSELESRRGERWPDARVSGGQGGGGGRVSRGGGLDNRWVKSEAILVQNDSGTGQVASAYPWRAAATSSKARGTGRATLKVDGGADSSAAPTAPVTLFAP